jgi:hypothetical protein
MEEYVPTPTDFEQVVDWSFIKKLQELGTFAHQTDKNVASFTPGKVLAAEKGILTQTIRISFFPNSYNVYELKRDEMGNKVTGQLYDPAVKATLEQVARLSGQFDRAYITIEGHSDSSMRGKVPASEAIELSRQRAAAVKDVLVNEFKFDPNKFQVSGKGWDVPAESDDAMNQAKNRRVEIGVYATEQS